MLSRTLKFVVFILCLAHLQNPRLVFLCETHQLNFAIHKTKHYCEYILKKQREKVPRSKNFQPEYAFCFKMDHSRCWTHSRSWTSLHLSRAQSLNSKNTACVMLAIQNRQWIQIFGSGHAIILSFLTSLDCGFIILTLRSLDKTGFVSSRCVSLGVVSYPSSE